MSNVPMIVDHYKLTRIEEVRADGSARVRFSASFEVDYADSGEAARAINHFKETGEWRGVDLEPKRFEARAQ